MTWGGEVQASHGCEGNKSEIFFLPEIQSMQDTNWKQRTMPGYHCHSLRDDGHLDQEVVVEMLRISMTIFRSGRLFGRHLIQT